MFEAVRGAGLLFDLDRAARIKAIGEASRLGLESSIFITFNPTSIYDPAYWLKSTIGAIERSELSSDRVVFEITESEYVRDDRHLRNILDFYRRSGFKIALDDLGAGYSSLNLLAALRPDFVKLDARLDQDVDHGYYRAAIASKLLELAKDLDICVIAEGVETEEQWRWLSDNGADLAQGYLSSPDPSSHRSLYRTSSRNPSPSRA